MTRMHNPPHPGEVLRDGVFTGTGITVTDFARRIGVTRVTLSNVLNGKNGVSADMAVRMATYRKIYALLRDDLPIIYLYNARWNFGMAAKVEGFDPVADGMLRLGGVKFAR